MGSDTLPEPFARGQNPALLYASFRLTTGRYIDRNRLPLARGNLSSEYREREGEAPAALLVEGATRAPTMEPGMIVDAMRDGHTTGLAL